LQARCSPTTAGRAFPDAYYQNYSQYFQGLSPLNFYTLAAQAGGQTSLPYSLAVKNVASSPTSIWLPDGLITSADEILGARYLQDASMAFASSVNDGYTISAMSCEASLPVIPLTGAADADGIESAYRASRDRRSG
jgi:hypothetical protein